MQLSLTRRTLEPSSLRISAPKSSTTLRLSVILPPLHFPPLSSTATRNYTMSLRSWLSTSTVSLTSTTTLSLRPVIPTCHRPIGGGVQGLADSFMALHMPFDSQAPKELHQDLWDHLLEASNELAALDGTYEIWIVCSAGPAAVWASVEGENHQDWIEKLAFACSHAHCVNEPDIGHQRMLWALCQVFDSLLIRRLTHVNWQGNSRSSAHGFSANTSTYWYFFKWS